MSLEAPIIGSAAIESPRRATATEIAPAGAWQAVNVRELWRHRELLFFLIWRDVKVRYKQTVLGVAWAVFQPAVMAGLFTLTISRVAKISVETMPYPLYAYLGFMIWQVFASMVGNASNSVVNSEHLITKIYFPRLMIPFSAGGTALVDFAASSTLVAAMLIWYGMMPGWQIVMLPVIVLIIVLTALGVGTLLAALNVAFRDFRIVIPFLIQAWMLGTVTIYLESSTKIGGNWQWLIALNPMTHLVAAFRASLTRGAIDFAALGMAGGFAVVLFLSGCMVFRKMERRFADII